MLPVEEGEIPYARPPMFVAPTILKKFASNRLFEVRPFVPPTVENMFVFGCIPHSGPSKPPPVTGTPACWVILVLAKVNALKFSIRKTPLLRRSWVAAAFPAGDDWSSAGTSWI